MSLGAGTLALKRLQLLQKRSWSVSEVTERLNKFRISQLEIDDEREETMGFCHPYSGEPHIEDFESLFVDNFLVFGIRKDQKKIPGTLFRLQLKAALEHLRLALPKDGEHSGAEGKKRKSQGGKVVSKAMREAAKDRIKAELTRRTLPAIRLTEVAWDLENGEVWLFSTSPAVFEDFEKLFLEAFETPFVVLGPGTIAFDFERHFLGLPVDLAPHLDIVPAGFLPEDSLDSSVSQETINMENVF